MLNNNLVSGSGEESLVFDFFSFFFLYFFLYYYFFLRRLKVKKCSLGKSVITILELIVSSTHVGLFELNVICLVACALF